MSKIANDLCTVISKIVTNQRKFITIKQTPSNEAEIGLNFWLRLCWLELLSCNSFEKVYPKRLIV